MAFSTEDDRPIVRVADRFRSRRHRWIALGVGIGLLALLSTGFYFAWPHLGKVKTELLANAREDDSESAVEETTSPVHETSSTTSKHDASAVPSTPRLPTGGVFPRRLLTICVHNYLFANPVSYGEASGQNFHALTDKLARGLHVPATQVVELSDAAPGQRPAPAPARSKGKSGAPKEPPPRQSTARPTSKTIIEQTVTKFLNTCRPQDRAVVLFVGHVVELDEQAYLVPLEGELTAKENLIPVTWLYQNLEKCPARQKVLILDTCRLDPSRGSEKPGSGPMGPKLDSLLANPPAGVQVWCSCRAKEYSYESEGDSIFLNSLAKSLTQKVIKNIQEPRDALPVEALAKEVERLTATAVTEQWKAKQTPRLSGAEPQNGAAYNKQEPLPPKIELPSPVMASGAAASAKDVESILREIELPPIRLASDETQPVRIAALVPFSAQALQPYQADYTVEEFKRNPSRYPFRMAVLDALEAMRNGFNPHNDAFSLQDSFPAGNNDSLKKDILKRQMKPAKVLGLLMEALDDLRKVGEERDQEPSKRWQAHYDYVLAELLARMAYVQEYDLMLGKIRKDELPELQPNVDTGWRLASKEKLSSAKDVKEMAAESRKIFAKIIKQYKGTPWEVLAKRERLTALGLEWQPTH